MGRGLGKEDPQKFGAQNQDWAGPSEHPFHPGTMQESLLLILACLHMAPPLTEHSPPPEVVNLSLDSSEFSYV